MEVSQDGTIYRELSIDDSGHLLRTSNKPGSETASSTTETTDATEETAYTSFVSSPMGDINTAAALRAQYAIETPKPNRRRHKKMTSQVIDDDAPEEPIVDQTAPLPLHSKKTERQQRKQQKRTQKLLYQRSITPSLTNLPSELVTEVLSHLFPKDIVSIRLTCRQLHAHTTTHNTTIARTIIHRRFWTLYRCFPVPVALTTVPASAHAALLHPKRQEMLNIHRKSYHQHVSPIDPTQTCTCMTCVFAWNNLCLLLDLHHWQPSLENREPLPIIPRGTNPKWNTDLLTHTADIVRTAMTDPLVYAHILALHWDTTVRTIGRNARWRRKVSSSPSSSTTPPQPNITNTTTLPTSGSSSGSAVSQKPRLYHLTPTDVERGTDEFLDRPGPPSYDFPYMRDNYYGLEAYCPNRKWSAESGRWHYYGLPPSQHERDLEWVRAWAGRVGPVGMTKGGGGVGVGGGGGGSSSSRVLEGTQEVEVGKEQTGLT